MRIETGLCLAVVVVCAGCAGWSGPTRYAGFGRDVPEIEVAASVAFTEGPAVDRAGNVYFSEMRGDRIMKLSTDGNLTTFRQPSNSSNGLVIDPQGRLVACEGGDAGVEPPRVTRTDLATGRVEVLADAFEGKRFNQPNDVTFDNKGRLYFSDRPRENPAPDQTALHAVYRIDPDGNLARILVEPEIDKPNGIMISPDDKTLYLIESHEAAGRARMIRAYDLQADGTVTNMRVFHNFYPGRSGDGMAIDSVGNLYVAAGLHRRRGTSETLDTRCGIHVFSPGGRLIQFVPIPEDTVTNCAFGGPDMQTLYITAGKTLFTMRTNVPGTRR